MFDQCAIVILIFHSPRSSLSYIMFCCSVCIVLDTPFELMLIVVFCCRCCCWLCGSALASVSALLIYSASVWCFSILYFYLFVQITRCCRSHSLSSPLNCSQGREQRIHTRHNKSVTFISSEETVSENAR